MNTATSLMMQGSCASASWAVGHLAAGIILTCDEQEMKWKSLRGEVTLNGPPPGTGLIRRFGSARFIEGGQVEWEAAVR